MSYELFFSPTSLSRRGPVNPSTLTFYNINLAETMPNLFVASKKCSQTWFK